MGKPFWNAIIESLENEEPINPANLDSLDGKFYIDTIETDSEGTIQFISLVQHSDPVRATELTVEERSPFDPLESGGDWYEIAYRSTEGH